MSTATTFAQARSGIITTIVEMQPTTIAGQSDLWRLVERVQDVPSIGLRSFFVEVDTPLPTGDIYGGCELHEVELLVWTSYGELPPAELQVAIGQDSIDLRSALQGAHLPGVPKFEPEGFQPSPTEDGRQWGAHVFTVSLFLPI